MHENVIHDLINFFDAHRIGFAFWIRGHGELDYDNCGPSLPAAAAVLLNRYGHTYVSLCHEATIHIAPATPTNASTLRETIQQRIAELKAWPEVQFSVCWALSDQERPEIAHSDDIDEQRARNELFLFLAEELQAQCESPIFEHENS